MTDILSVQRANHIAAYLDVPGLFVGTYQGTRIDYLHVSSYQTRHVSSMYGHCLVIKSSRGLIATLYDTKGTAFPVVRLPDDTQDPLYDLLKRHKQFPAGDPAYQVTALSVMFLFEGGFLSHDIYDPQHATSPSPELFKAFVSLHEKITEQFQNPAAILPQPPEQPSSHPHIHPRRFHSFARRCKIMTIFGQSGLFDEADAPHDTEYLLACVLDVHTYTFIKTRRFFRGMRQISIGNYRPGVDPIVDMNAPDEDLIALFTQDIPPVFSRKAIYVDARLSLKEGDLAADFSVIPEQAAPALWRVLKTLIAHFPDK